MAAYLNCHTLVKAGGHKSTKKVIHSKKRKTEAETGAATALTRVYAKDPVPNLDMVHKRGF